MQTGPASRSGWNLDLVVRTTARLGLLMLPAGLLLFASIQAEGSAQTLLWYGATFQALMFCFLDRKSTRLNSSHIQKSRMPSSA